MYRYEKTDWDEWEKIELPMRARSFRALGSLDEAFRAAVESSVYWNRMYREAMERERNNIREERNKDLLKSAE